MLFQIDNDPPHHPWHLTGKLQLEDAAMGERQDRGRPAC